MFWFPGLPITRFLRIARAILLKGNGLADLAPEIRLSALFAAVAAAIGVKRYRQTLDYRQLTSKSEMLG